MTQIFLRCCQVQFGYAEGISNAIKRATASPYYMGQICQKQVALGSDGASFMTGKKSDVITVLQGDKPSVIGVHCCGNRLELAYKGAVHKNPLAEKITTLLSGLYYFYRNNALYRTNLKNALTCLVMKVLLPMKACGTRWVSHVYKALDHFLNGYKAFQCHLEQLASSNESGKSKAKEQGFMKLMKCHNVIAMALSCKMYSLYSRKCL